jgi:hypothetical protein
VQCEGGALPESTETVDEGTCLDVRVEGEAIKNGVWPSFLARGQKIEMTIF